MSTRQFGARIERNIDPKLLRGEGAFVDDIPLPQAAARRLRAQSVCARAHPFDRCCRGGAAIPA